MELNEAVLRILRHSRLIVAVVVVCLAIQVVGSRSGEDSYTATSRVSLGSEPANEDEASALVDTAQALVTTPGEVEAALGRYAAQRDAGQVEQSVEVESVGVSGVLTISVSDTDPDVAAAVVNSLSRRLLVARRSLDLAPLEERLTEVDDQLATANDRIRTITRRRSEVPEEIDASRLQLDAALSRQSGLQAEREALIASLDATPRPVFLARATVPTTPDPSGRFADVVVAGLLGLILGIGITAVVETLSPTVAGRDALSRTLGAPLLGRIPSPRRRRAGKAGAADDVEPRVALSLTLAARSAGVGVVHLTSTGPGIDLEPLVDQLGRQAPDLTVQALGEPPPSPRSGGTEAAPDDEGLAVVAPEHQPRSALADVEQLLAISQWPLIGIITYPSPIWRRPRTPGAFGNRLRRARGAVIAWFGGHRRDPQHARPSVTPAHVWLRLRRLARAPWGSETRS